MALPRAWLGFGGALASLVGASACLLDKTGYVEPQPERTSSGGASGAGDTSGGGGAGGASSQATTTHASTSGGGTGGGGGGTTATGGAGGTSSAIASCSNGVQNQGESDVDCGGPCGPCGFGRACAQASDCAVACEAGQCVPAPVAVWALQTTSSAPPKRYLPKMVYDASRKRAVLFGGLDTQLIAPPDTWEWDGATWAAVTTAVAAGRTKHMMAYDRNREVTVLFGGVDPQGIAFGETMEYEGLTWTGKAELSSPPARWAGAMSFDGKRNQIVLFGGAGTSTIYDDTWVYDGVAWVEQTPVHRPPPRANAAMTYDAAREVILLFGGDSATTPGAFSAETWTWDGSDWALAKPMVQPAPRSYAALSFDPIRKRAVLFGGVDDLGLYADTWEWDGTSWTLIAPATPGPTASFGNPLVFDLVRRRSFYYQSWTAIGFPGQSWEYYALATPCAELSECGAAACVDGLCCDSECGICAACNLAKTPGRCAPVLNAVDPDTCAGGSACDDSGQCVSP